MENLFQQNIPLKSENAYQKFILYRAFTNPETLEYFFLDDSNGGLFDDIGLGDIYRDYHKALTEIKDESIPDSELPSMFRKRQREERSDVFSNLSKQQVCQVIERFLTETSSAPVDESVIGDNIRILQNTLNLNDLEANVLLFYTHLDCNRYIEKVVERIPHAASENKKVLNLSVLLGEAQQRLTSLFNQQSKLFTAGLLERKTSLRGIRTDDFVPEYEMPSDMRHRMCVPNTNVTQLVNHVFEDAPAITCKAADFSYIAEYKGFVSLIREAVKLGEKAVNILIYGAPGTGKTTLANLVLREAGLSPKFVKYANKEDESLSPVQRLKYFNLCQQTLSVNNDTGLIFDEASDVFAPNTGRFFISVASPTSKNHIHSSLENNTLPTIFICNDISEFDPATLSRFLVILKMPQLSRAARLAMLENNIPPQHASAISKAWLQGLANNQEITPRHVANSFKVAKLTEHTEQSFETTVNGALDNYLAHLPHGQSKYQLPLLYEPSLINCQYSAVELAHRFARCPNLRVLFHGLPGTGKTAFAVYLLEQANLPYELVKASDVYSAYVGETEKNIASLFRNAKLHKHALLIDEVDSLASSRQNMQHAWQKTMVDQFLQELDVHQGLVIATTNFNGNLDQAVYRRFYTKIELLPMQEEAKWDFLNLTTARLALKADMQERYIRPILISMTALTPGDFNAVNMRSEWINIETVSDYLRELKSELVFKQVAKPIGFVRGTFDAAH